MISLISSSTRRRAALALLGSICVAALLVRSAAARDRAHDDDLEAELARGKAELQQHVAALTASVRSVPGIPGDARAVMLALLGHDYWEGSSRPTTAEVTAAFETWVTAARALPPTERTDAFLVADRVMEFVGFPATSDAEVSRHGASLKLAGAEFVYAPLGGAYVYAHSFLRDALATAPRGPTRDRALLREMEIGFDFTGMCSGGEEEFAKVIATGEPLIGRSADRHAVAAAHFMVADAYATVVALASGAVDADYVDASVYKRKEREARRRAIEHYRAGFAIDDGSEDARLAKRDLELLVAGSRPVLTGSWARHRFYHCIYD